MSTDFFVDREVTLPEMQHRAGCRCTLHARRRLGGALFGAAALSVVGPLSPAFAQQDPECKRSSVGRLAPAEQVEQAASQQYVQMLRQAEGKRALGPQDHPQVQRLRYVARRIVPFAVDCNERSRAWKWDVNLIGSPQVNAFCMPGGKIAFFYGILQKLQLTDDEVAVVMGHEVAHALLEHARERIVKNTGTELLLRGGAALFGLGQLGDLVAQGGTHLLNLTYGRGDELEADALGLLLAARAGYDPRAGVTLWKKMMALSKSAPPTWLSTHPSGASRIQDIEARLPRVAPIYARADKPDQHFGPPKQNAS
jgi:predicted Zn-dependent protease